MKKLSALISSIFIFSVCAEASENINDEKIIDNTRDSFFYRHEGSHEVLSQENKFPLTKSKVQNYSEVLSSSSLNSEEEAFYNDIMENASFNVNGKEYTIHINNNLKEHLTDKNVQNELFKTIQFFQQIVPSDKVVGYTFSWSNKKINVSPFLGDNAK